MEQRPSSGTPLLPQELGARNDMRGSRGTVRGQEDEAGNGERQNYKAPR